MELGSCFKIMSILFLKRQKKSEAFGGIYMRAQSGYLESFYDPDKKVKILFRLCCSVDRRWVL